MRPEQFKALREAAGMTQVECADRFGVDVRTIGRWEAGDFPIGPPVEALIRMLAHPDGARLHALVYGKPRSADPLGDVGDYDQRVHDLRAARSGRAPTTLPPPRQTFRTPEHRDHDATDLDDPLPDADAYDAKVRAARKRGPTPRVAAAAKHEIDPDDPIGEEVAHHNARIAQRRAARAKEIDE